MAFIYAHPTWIRKFPSRRVVYSNPRIHGQLTGSITGSVSRHSDLNMLVMAKNIYRTLFWTFVSLASAENRTCYHLDGSEASNHVPCSSNDVTNCCASNDLCLSNGLCYLQGSQGLTLTRGTCTDSGWGSDCYAPCCMFLTLNKLHCKKKIQNEVANYSQQTTGATPDSPS